MKRFILIIFLVFLNPAFAAESEREMSEADLTNKQLIQLNNKIYLLLEEVKALRETVEANQIRNNENFENLAHYLK